MFRKAFFVFSLVLIAVLFAACAAPDAATPAPSGDPGLPNPASVYCEEQGGRVDLRTAADGSVTGICVFADGSECDEWAFYRGECQPGELPANATEPAAAGWQVYTDDTTKLRFEYPVDATVSVTGDTGESLIIEGPLMDNGEHWPVITINHPSNREEFRPPEGSDLQTWLADKNLAFFEEPQADMKIAGQPGVHIRRDGNGQSYAEDTYFFAHAGQLYSISILHTGSQEDWEIYNRFLESIEFGR